MDTRWKIYENGKGKAVRIILLLECAEFIQGGSIKIVKWKLKLGQRVKEKWEDMGHDECKNDMIDRGKGK
jgi:hypothetical protein